MNSDMRSVGMWAVYATALVVASLFVPTSLPSQPAAPNGSTRRPIENGPVPPTPELTVTANTGDLEKNGEVRIQFRLDQRAPSRLEIRYRLGSKTAEQNRDFIVEPAPLGTLVINQGESEAPLVLKKLIPHPPDAAVSRTTKDVDVTLSLSKEEGFKYAANTRRDWKFPFKTSEFGPPYQVSVVAPPAFQERDARRMEEITVVFQLDRAPTERPISIRFRIGGNAHKEDYEVVDRPKDDTLWFQVDQREARIVLRRLPGPRGLGDRVLQVACESPQPRGAISLGTGPSSVEIRVPDPIPGLSWSLDPLAPGARDPHDAVLARLRVTITPPSRERVDLRYRIVYPNRADLRSQERSIELKPPADLWASEATKAEQVIEFPPDDLVYPKEKEEDLRMTARLEPMGGFPSLPEPLPFVVHDAEKEKLSGRVLVILVLTESLVRDGQAACQELQKFQTTLRQAGNENLRDGLVGRSIFVVDGKKRLFRFSSETIKDLQPFPGGAKLGEMLDNSTKAFVKRLFDRISSQDEQAKLKKVVLIHDVADTEPGPVSETLDEWLHGRFNWWVLWIGGDFGKSPLAAHAEKVRKDVDLNAFGPPNPGLSEQLFQLLRDGG